jgi:hypothetical protein
MKRPLSIANLIMVMFVTLTVCFGGVYFIRHGLLTVRVAFAEEQLGVFRDMVAKAKGGSQEDCLESLQQTVSYYPSGTKQRKGTKLDTMVEQARRDAVMAIIESLRRVSPTDLGPEPEAWLK